MLCWYLRIFAVCRFCYLDSKKFTDLFWFNIEMGGSTLPIGSSEVLKLVPCMFKGILRTSSISCDPGIAIYDERFRWFVLILSDLFLEFLE